MRLRRRSLLIAIAGTLLVGDVAFVAWRMARATSVFVTHVGIDSLTLSVPEATLAEAPHNGRWGPVEERSERSAEVGGGTTRTLTYVSLAPDPTYRHFLSMIRDLKARGTCNVLIREGAVPRGSSPDSQITPLVLCGSSLGDAGFADTLPPDGVIQL